MRDLPPVEQSASLRRYLEQNKEQIVNALRSIDLNISRAGPLNKDLINYIINQGYFYVRDLEARLHKRYLFDVVIQRP